MNFDRLNQWLMIAANLGVLAGILFLAIEIEQNTTMTRAQTRDAMTEKQMAYYELVINNVEAENLVRRSGNISELDRTSDEFRKYVFIFLTQLRMWENELYQYRQGLFDTEEFQSRLYLWGDTMSRDSPTGEVRRQIWESQIPNFSADFVETISAELERD